MKKETWEFSVWFDRKLNEMEERKSVLKIKPTDIILSIFIIILLVGVSAMNSLKIPSAILIVIISSLLMQFSVSQRAIISQEKRIRELEKLTQNQSSEPT